MIVSQIIVSIVNTKVIRSVIALLNKEMKIVKKKDMDENKNKKDYTNNGQRDLQEFDNMEAGIREKNWQQQGYQGDKVQQNQQQE